MSHPMLPLVEGTIVDVLANAATYALICAEALDGLHGIPNNSIDFGLMDPPYALGTREPTLEDIVAYLRGAELNTGGDFMQMDWSLPSVKIWREVYRVLKPGAFLAVYAGTQTDDLLSIGLRAAGFERRDAIEIFGTSRLAWLQAQGMAKGLNISKAIDEAAGRERQVVGPGQRHNSRKADDDDRFARFAGGVPPTIAPATSEAELFEGYHTNVAPKHEVVLLFAKPLDAISCAQIHAVTGWDHWHVVRDLSKPNARAARAKLETLHGVTFGTFIDDAGVERPREARVVKRRPLHPNTSGGEWSELQARVPGGEWEVLAAFDRRPFKPWSSRTVVANALVHGTGGLNIDACRVYTDWSDRPDSWKRSGHSAKPDADKIAAPPGTGINCHARGRFAPNVLLNHCQECELIGTRQVRASAEPGFSASDPNWRYGDERQPFEPHGNGDGTETVESLACLVGCSACTSTWIAESGGRAPVCDCGTPGEWICSSAHLDEQAGKRKAGGDVRTPKKGFGSSNLYGGGDTFDPVFPGYADDGCASRFFPIMHPMRYSAKASPAERNAGTSGTKNEHVAVKPGDHVCWIARLIGGKPGAVGLTSFAGCGSEVAAMVAEGFRAIGIEREQVHVTTATKRVPAVATLIATKTHKRATVSRVVSTEATPATKPQTSPTPSPRRQKRATRSASGQMTLIVLE